MHALSIILERKELSTRGSFAYYNQAPTRTAAVCKIAPTGYDHCSMEAKNDSGNTTIPEESWSIYTAVPLGIFLSLLSLITTFGNVLVLYAVRTEKRLQTVSQGYEDRPRKFALFFSISVYKLAYRIIAYVLMLHFSVIYD